MDYSTFMLARLEYQQRVRALKPVSEYGTVVKINPPGWMAQQAGQLLYTLGHRLALLGERMKQGHFPYRIEQDTKTVVKEG